MVQIMSFSIYTIGMSCIIVNTFNFIFTLINLMAIISFYKHMTVAVIKIDICM